MTGNGKSSYNFKTPEGQAAFMAAYDRAPAAPAYSAQSAIDRARELIPQIQAEIIAGAGEMLPIEQPDAVNRHIIEFLEQI